MKPKSFNIGED